MVFIAGCIGGPRAASVCYRAPSYMGGCELIPQGSALDHLQTANLLIATEALKQCANGQFGNKKAP